jgi:D-sedoheptulose 7-phosphate isomerase
MIEFKQRLVEIKKGFDNLQQSNVSEQIESALGLIVPSLERRQPMLVCGNGGSAADALHITGELVGRFLVDRKALNVICLSSNVSVITAWANDYEYESIFARQVEAHGLSGGVLFCLSTSGNSKNVLRALKVAKQMGLSTIGMTGKGGGLMAQFCDVLVDVPSNSTPRVQEMHLVLYHYICERIEAALTSKLNEK